MLAPPKPYSVAALELRRYDVPTGAELIVRAGIAMRVTEGFIIDGTLILDGKMELRDD